MARLEGSDQNDLPDLLRGWFGEDAGAPGTAHQVLLKDSGSEWMLEPAEGRRSGGWSDAQIEILLDHYFAMLDDEQAGRRYVKAAHNREFQEATGRSRGSIEFKLANVSAVLDALNEPYIDGYKPTENYQESLRTAVEAQLQSRRQDQ